MSRARDLANVADDVSTGTVVTTASPSLGRRNLIINGAMQVAQRGTSFTFSNGNTPFVVDRFEASENGTPSFVFTVSQDTDAPSNFKQSVKFDCTTAEPSLAVGARATLRHKVEAQDLQSLAYGTADAQDITFSFWVKTNVTGTYTVWFYNEDGNRQTTNTFSISTQDTWERKTVLISADTVGSINNDNGTGLQIEITLAAGTNYTTGTALNGEWETGTTTVNRSVGQTANLASSTSNYINITGVQLEVGSVATPFEHRSYGEELALCQRYYQRSGKINYQILGRWPSTSGPGLAHLQFICPMRSQPTMSTEGTWSSGNSYTTPTYDAKSNSTGQITGSVSQGTNTIFYAHSGEWIADAEL